MHSITNISRTKSRAKKALSSIFRETAFSFCRSLSASWTHLFSLDGTPFFLSLEEPSFLPENSRMIPVR